MKMDTIDALIIKDSEFIYVGESINAFGKLMKECFAQYREALRKASENAAASGAVHDGLEIYREYIEKLCIISEKLGSKCKSVITSYLAEIEAADSYLYDGTKFDEVRDFSDEQEAFLRKCLDDPWTEWTDNFWDKLYGKILDFLNLTDWFDSAKNYLHKSYKLLLDYNDETAQGLEMIFRNVHEIDRNYSSSIAGCGEDFFTCHFDNVCLTMCNIRDLLDEMADIIDPRSGSFTPSKIRERLGKAYDELIKRFETTINIVDYNGTPEIVDISDFASQPWANRYFHCFYDATIMYVGDMGGYEAFKMVVYNMFDIFKTTVTSKEDYNDYLRKKQIMEVLDNVTDSEYYSDSDEKEFVDDSRTILKYVKKYGSDIYEYLNTHRTADGNLILDGRTVKARHFREFLDGVDGAGDILKYGDEGIDYLSRLLADYTKGTEVLDSFEKNYESDPAMQKCIEDIRRLYDKEFFAWTEEAMDKYREVGYDIAVEALADAEPVGAVLKAIDKTIDVFGEYTGDGDKAKSMLEALGYYDLLSSTESAYNGALEAFQNADPNSEEYATLAKDLRNCFELNKKTNVKLLKAMAASSSGTKKSYYEYCAKQAESMSLLDSAEPDVMSYEEFCLL